MVEPGAQLDHHVRAIELHAKRSGAGEEQVNSLVGGQLGYRVYVLTGHL